jgi:hypothetical protein
MKQKNSIVLVLFLCILGCGQAGLNSNPVSVQSSDTSAQLSLIGYVGLGPLYKANINVFDISDYDHPVFLQALNSDAEGVFEVNLDSVEGIELILFVVSDGHYIDPFSLTTVNAAGHTLTSIYHIGYLQEKSDVYVTPLSTLFTSFVDCLHHKSSLSESLFLYALSVFQTVFDFNLQEVDDLYLNLAANETRESQKYTLLNLAFSNKSESQLSGSGIELVNTFVTNLNEKCSLLLDSTVEGVSTNYSKEFFRADLLASTLSLTYDPAFSYLTDSIDMESYVQEIRQDQGILFGFNTYE